MIILTKHAVSQYISRFDRSLSEATARAELERLVRYADRLKERSLKGDTLWALPNGALLVTRSGPDGPVATTVLKERYRPDPGPTPEELEMLLEENGDVPIVLPSDTGELHFRIVLRYKLSKHNQDIALEKIERALRSAVGNLVKNGIAGATLEEKVFVCEVHAEKEQSSQ